MTQGGQWTGTVGQSDTALTCRNNKDGVPPTGLRRDAAPALAAVAAAGLVRCSAAEGGVVLETQEDRRAAWAEYGSFLVRAGALAALLAVLFGVVFGLAIQPDD